MTEMNRAAAFELGEQAIADFVSHQLGGPVSRVVRLDSFAVNAVYDVATQADRFIVKASMLHDALRAERWACVRAANAGCAAPAIVGHGRLPSRPDVSAFIMSCVDGRPIAAERAAFRELGNNLRRLYSVRMPGFGWLASAPWDAQGNPAPRHASWLGFLQSIVSDTRSLANRYSIAASVAAAAAAAIDARRDALAGVDVAALCHGDLKPPHILTDGRRLTGLIDWGDAAAADPLWDIARFAHRTDEKSFSLLRDGYTPDSAWADALLWRMPLYGTLWILVDAVVDHRLGGSAQAALEAAMNSLSDAR